MVLGALFWQLYNIYNNFNTVYHKFNFIEDHRPQWHHIRYTRRLTIFGSFCCFLTSKALILSHCFTFTTRQYYISWKTYVVLWRIVRGKYANLFIRAGWVILTMMRLANSLSASVHLSHKNRQFRCHNLFARTGCFLTMWLDPWLISMFWVKYLFDYTALHLYAN